MTNYKRYSLIICIAGLLLILTGVTYSFFNYTRTGLANNFRVGRIYFSSNQSGNINLTNLFPIKASDLSTDVGNHDSVTINITGDTEYTKGIEYLVSFKDVSNTVNNKEIPIGFQVETSSIGTDDTEDYWQHRGGNSSIYYVSEDDYITEDKQIVAGYITSGVTGINGSITITAFVDADGIAISDTYDGSESDNMETTQEWVNNRVVFTTTEWNSLESLPISFKVRVEANEGIWVIPDNTPSDCFITSNNQDNTLSIDDFAEDQYIYTYNSEMTEEEIANCIENIDYYLDNNTGSSIKSNPNLDFKVMKLNSNIPRFITTNWQAGETKEAFCRGTGTYDGKTFQEKLDEQSFNNISDMVQFNYANLNIIERPMYCNNTNITIPRTINGKTVTTISELAFHNNGLTKVKIPNTITTIKYGAFAQNELTSVIIPDSVTTIEADAFSYNQLTSVVISNNLSRIETEVFYNNNLTNVIIPNSVISIGIGSFSNNLLSSLNIPSSVVNLESSSFSYNHLTNLIIPDTVISIGGAAFRNNQLTSLTIGNSVTTIGDNAFSNNQLTSVSIPNNVTSISYDAFSNNDNLTSLTIDMTTIPILSSKGFNSLTNVTIGSNVTTKDGYAFSNNHISSITIPNNVTSIGYHALSNNDLTSITIDMTTIPSDFRSQVINSTLTEVIIGNHVIEIGGSAFSSGGINSLTIGDSVTIIGSSAFAYNQLESVIIPNSVTSIEINAFLNNKLTTMNLSDNIQLIGISAFLGNQLTSVTIGSGITSIGDNAFYKSSTTSNPNLASIAINKSCTVIKSMADYPWIGNVYRAGTTIYGSNNEVCNAY